MCDHVQGGGGMLYSVYGGGGVRECACVCLRWKGVYVCMVAATWCERARACLRWRWCERMCVYGGRSVKKCARVYLRMVVAM